ncbi:hypothetical protein LFAB_14720 [Lactiplantibacillus fabifermentans T30PCM01]|uniref:Uncharacterized protein n=1 Tax=Lactiplantibacillus fabifermentans T30PCM01 TaxID=1400520 RepID=W6T522_9LACO|nr:hypothetical protein LFAB_14720 [Lactiplantibacillus fabifermentans T30PCM01]
MRLAFQAQKRGPRPLLRLGPVPGRWNYGQPTAAITNFKVRFETAFWLEPVATATGITAGQKRQTTAILMKNH